jgi:transporter family-2 protein
MYLGILVALLGGIFISVQGSLNGMVGSNSSVSSVISIPVAIQFMIYFVIIFFNQSFRKDVMIITEYKHGLIYLLISALLGIGIMVTMTVSFMKIGPLLALATVVFSQLLISMIIEHFGFFGTVVKTINVSKLMGLALMLLGVVVFNRN